LFDRRCPNEPADQALPWLASPAAQALQHSLSDGHA